MSEFSFADKVKEQRIAYGLTHSDLSKLIGIERANYTSFESGKRGLTKTQITRLAKALELPISLLRSWERLDGITKEELHYIENWLKFRTP